MEKIKLAISAQAQFGIPIAEQIPLFKEVGFDGFFTAWDDNLCALREIADKVGISFTAVHAPTRGAAKMWGEDADEYVLELCRCVEDTARAGIGTLIVHTFIEPDMQSGAVDRKMKSDVTQIGLSNYRKVYELAKKLGVLVAFENAEGEQFTEAVMKEFACAGFCWDSGHERAYAEGTDYMEKYGSRLAFTHLNDNLGCRDARGYISGLDDMHLLPFDGCINWSEAAEKLRRAKKCEYLGFELKILKPFSTEPEPRYSGLTLKEYLETAFLRAEKVRNML